LKQRTQPRGADMLARVRGVFQTESQGNKKRFNLRNAGGEKPVHRKVSESGRSFIDNESEGPTRPLLKTRQSTGGREQVDQEEVDPGNLALCCGLT